jgi:RimJ/RimL family protein N-acetyltransferase
VRVNLIVGEGLGLRMPELSDRERWLELFHDLEQLRFGMPAVIPVPAHIDDIDERITEARRKFATQQPTTFVVVDESDPDRFLGTVGWSFHVPAALRIADVGYSVHPESRGRGVASRALRTVTRWLTTDADGPRLARVQLDHSVENPASCRTALAAGFALEGVRTGYLPLRDRDAPDGVRRHDVCLHGLVAHP